ncbi:uncharacterized protein LOC126553085 [Aphis gossypii]|uniref:uncharacterized protein LOC126553085 n=1 Tax=Aphis gossypii TaxID=80765 RepID=UPI0021592ECA|nr:uncharacterized protein LOC126553085 [Aphis gossypii]
MLSLAFLPEEEIPDAFKEIKEIMPNNASSFVQWFEDNYTLGEVRRIVRNTEHRNIPLFPPSLWSIYENIDNGIPRTSNHAEAWHRRWNELVGRAHIGLFTLIKELQKEQSKVDADIEAILRGAPKPRPTNVQQKREQRLKTAFDNREGKTRLDYLRGIAHNLTM